MPKPPPKLTKELRDTAVRYVTIRVPILDPPASSNMQSGRLDGRLNLETGRTLVKIMHALREENCTMLDGGVIDLAQPGVRLKTLRWILEQIGIAEAEQAGTGKR